MCVRIQFTMSLVPEKLSCLNECFSDVPKNDCKDKCRRGIQSAVKAATRRKFTDDIDSYLDDSDDKDKDCILFNGMSDPEERNSTFSLSLIPEIGQRRKKAFSRDKTLHQQAIGELPSGKEGWDIWSKASKHLQNPVKQQQWQQQQQERISWAVYFPVNHWPELFIYNIWHHGQLRCWVKIALAQRFRGISHVRPIWNRNEMCSLFLPKIDWLESDSSGSTFATEGDTTARLSSKRRTSNTRSSGPSSSIIQR